MEMHVMTKTVCAIGVLVASAGAYAAPFNALSFEAGGGVPGIAGEGFTVSSGGFFNTNVTDTVAAQGAAGFTAANFGEFDSYFALDGFGPAARNRSVGTSNNSTATTSFYGNYGAPGTSTANYDIGESIAGYQFIVGPGSHIGDFGNSGSAASPNNRARAGIGVAPPPVSSTFAPNASGGRSAFDGIFVGRMTVQAGATLSGGMLFNTQAGGSANLSLGGPAVAMATENGPQLLALRAYRVATVDITAASTTGPAEDPDTGEPIAFGRADVYDLWVQVIPTPGAVALFGMAGVAGLRRRRA
ncbi:MAG: hypothetical protein SFZ24_11155 [Planctomycetota bacterium]|nr:hypothetical protein [Planctomycetota bacterium]